MKKMIIVILALTFLLPSAMPVYADETFSLYNGIQFGMTIEKVAECFPSSRYRSTDNLDREYIYTVGCTIADVFDVTIAVHFDENGLSKSVTYLMGKYDDVELRGKREYSVKQEKVDYQQYNRLDTVLQNKYGYTEYNNTTVKRLPFDNVPLLYAAATGYNVYAMTSVIGRETGRYFSPLDRYYDYQWSCPNYRQWVVPVSNGYVVVEHSLVRWDADNIYNGATDYQEVIHYAFLTEEEYAQLIKKDLDVYSDL